MLLLFVFPADYLASREPLETVQRILVGLTVSLVSVGTTVNDAHKVLVEVPLTESPEKAITLGPCPPTYLDVCWVDGRDVMTFRLEGGVSDAIFDGVFDTLLIDWLGDPSNEVTERIDALMDRCVDPMSPQGLEELRKVFADLKIGLFEFEALLPDIKDYVWATIVTGDFPVLNSKGYEPSWVQSYHEG